MCTVVDGGSIHRAARRISAASDQTSATPMASHRTKDRREPLRGGVLGGGVSGFSVTFQNNSLGGSLLILRTKPAPTHRRGTRGVGQRQLERRITHDVRSRSPQGSLWRRRRDGRNTRRSRSGRSRPRGAGELRRRSGHGGRRYRVPRTESLRRKDDPNDAAVASAQAVAQGRLVKRTFITLVWSRLSPPFGGSRSPQLAGCLS
jgi:hypothetical protein